MTKREAIVTASESCQTSHTCLPETLVSVSGRIDDVIASRQRFISQLSPARVAEAAVWNCPTAVTPFLAPRRVTLRQQGTSVHIICLSFQSNTDTDTASLLTKFPQVLKRQRCMYFENVCLLKQNWWQQVDKWHSALLSIKCPLCYLTRAVWTTPVTLVMAASTRTRAAAGYSSTMTPAPTSPRPRSWSSCRHASGPRGERDQELL